MKKPVQTLVSMLLMAFENAMHWYDNSFVEYVCPKCMY